MAKKKKEKGGTPEEKRARSRYCSIISVQSRMKHWPQAVVPSSEIDNPSGKNALHLTSGRNVGRQLPD